MENNKSFNDFIEKIKELGYKVYMSDKYLDMAFVVNSDDVYGTIYFKSSWGEPRISRSINHMPNRMNGSGFLLDGGEEWSGGVTFDNLDKDKIDEIFQLYPKWMKPNVLPTKMPFSQYLVSNAYWVVKNLKEV